MDSQNKIVMAVLAYIGPLVIIPYLMAKDDAFVKFHIRQGLVLLVIEVVCWILAMVFLPLLLILWIVKLIILVLAIIGIINATQNKQKELPLVGSYAKYFNI